MAPFRKPIYLIASFGLLGAVLGVLPPESGKKPAPGPGGPHGPEGMDY